MYVDKLDGLVDMAFYDRMSNQWRDEQNRCQREIERRQNADKSYLDEGVALLDLGPAAARMVITIAHGATPSCHWRTTGWPSRWTSSRAKGWTIGAR
jgi:hypothetical protein